MKKMIAMAFVAIIVMTSCSDNDSGSNDQEENFILLTKTVATYSGNTVTTNLTYEGNELMTAVDDKGRESTYIYMDNLLTKHEIHENGELLAERTFNYDENNKLIEYTMIWQGNSVEKSKFSYNSNGSVATEFYIGSVGGELGLSTTGTVYYTNANITKYSYTYDGNDEPIIIEWTYDDKNNPSKNVFAHDVMNLAEVTTGFAGGPNNILTKISNDPDQGVYQVTYAYNADNYPVSSSSSIDGEEYFTQQYFYE